MQAGRQACRQRVRGRRSGTHQGARGKSAHRSEMRRPTSKSRADRELELDRQRVRVRGGGSRQGITRVEDGHALAAAGHERQCG